MRLRAICLLAALLFAAALPAAVQAAEPTPAGAMFCAAGTAPGPLAAAAAQQVPRDVDVDIEVNDGAWYKNPIVIGIAVLVLVLIVVLATRGGGTTIVEKKS